MPMCESAIRRIALCGIVIIVSSPERKRIPNHWKLDCLLHGLLYLRTKGTSLIRITGSLLRLESLTSRLFVKNYSLAYNKENTQTLSGLTSSFGVIFSHIYILRLPKLARESSIWEIAFYSIVIMVTWHKRYCTPSHWQLDCLRTACSG